MKDSLRRTVLLALLGSISLMTLLVLPVMVGAYVDHLGLSESEAGWLAAAGFLGTATGAILFALRIHHLDLHKIALMGLSLMIVCDAASIGAVGLPIALLTALRIAAGFGSAAVYAAVMTTYARRQEPDRAYGLFMAMQFVFSALGLFVLPWVVPDIGVTGLFAIFMVLDLAALMLVGQLPYRHERLGQVGGTRLEWNVLLTRASVACLLGIGLFESYNMAQFTYVERMGQSMGLDADQIGMTLGISTLMGIPGGFGVTLLGVRFGHFKPILIAVLAQVIAFCLLLYGSTLGSYFLAMCLLGMAWGFTLPYFQAIEADIDRGGTVVVAGSFATGLAGFAGPAVAASLVKPGDYSVMLMSCIVVGLVVILLARYVTSRVKPIGR